MDELIGRLATNASIDSAVAEKTVGIILGFLRNEGPAENVEALPVTIMKGATIGMQPGHIGPPAFRARPARQKGLRADQAMLPSPRSRRPGAAADCRG